jgi:hypothetical protein
MRAHELRRPCRIRDAEPRFNNPGRRKIMPFGAFSFGDLEVEYSRHV